jgi:ribosome biogenesis GTPase
MKGIVYKSTGSWYHVKNDQGVFYECRLKGKFRIKGIKSTNPVAVGDIVYFEVDKKGDEEFGVIYNIEERNNYIIRKSVNLSKQTQIIAANIDLAFLLVTLNNPPTFTAFIDRFLVNSEAYGIKTILLFNKIDSYSEMEMSDVKSLAQLYRSIGYDCIEISAKTGQNIQQVKSLMKNKVSVFFWS